MKSFSKESFVADESEFRAVIFTSNTCGGCRMMKPGLEELEKAGEISVHEVNIMLEKEMADMENITSLPTTLIFKGEDIIERVVGFRPSVAIQQILDKAKGDK